MKIRYEGIVRIKKYNKRNNFLGSWEIHNTGYSRLFEFLANTLTRENVSESDKPYKILLADNTTSLSDLLERTSSPNYVEGNPPAVRYSFFLPYSRLLNPDPNGLALQNKTLYLLPRKYVNNNVDTNEVYASIEIKEEITLHKGEYLSILWDLSFVNNNTPEPTPSPEE